MNFYFDPAQAGSNELDRDSPKIEIDEFRKKAPFLGVFNLDQVHKRDDFFAYCFKADVLEFGVYPPRTKARYRP